MQDPPGDDVVLKCLRAPFGIVLQVVFHQVAENGTDLAAGHDKGSQPISRRLATEVFEANAGSTWPPVFPPVAVEEDRLAPLPRLFHAEVDLLQVRVVAMVFDGEVVDYGLTTPAISFPVATILCIVGLLNISRALDDEADVARGNAVVTGRIHPAADDQEVLLSLDAHAVASR